MSAGGKIRAFFSDFIESTRVPHVLSKTHWEERISKRTGKEVSRRQQHQINYDLRRAGHF